MKKIHALLAAVLCAALIVCLLAGCASNTPASTTAAPATTAAATTAAPATSAAPATTAPPDANSEHVDLSFVWTNWNNKSAEDEEVFAWMDEKFNMTFDWVNLASDVRAEKLGVMWASGEKFTASFGLEGTSNSQCLQVQYDNGWVTPLDDYLTACPMLQNDISQASWNFVRMDDGKLYGVPETGCYVKTGLWVRQDWLKQAGLEVPETLEDLEKVMDAFAHTDPDGNGADDTYGTAALFGSYNSFDHYLLGAFLPYGPSWQPMTDGSDPDTLYPYWMQPEFKDYLAMLADWTDKGYIHPNQVLMNYDTSIAAFAQGEIGTFFTWYGEGDSGVGLLLAAYPDADPVFVSSPGKTAGTGGSAAQKEYGGSIVFNKLASEAEVARYLSILEYFDSEEGNAVRNYGIPGVQWVDNGDTVKLPDGKEKVYASYCRLPGGPYTNHWRPLEGGLDCVNVATVACYANKLNYVMPYDYMFPYKWAGTESENKISDLNKIINTAEDAIGTGTQPVDSFDNTIKEWLAAGGQKYIEEYNAQYKQLAPVYGNK